MIHNFYAGPSVIDHSVLNEAIDQITPGDNQLSLLEISHRSKRFGEVMEETIALAKELLQLEQDFEVIFLQGGGRQQFFQIPFNLSKVFYTACYVDTGSWANQAFQEAQHFGNASIIASSKENGYRSIPEVNDLPEKSSYLYVCSNNTIYGTQFREFPDVQAPLIADMSSDLFSQELNFNQFDLFYAATQKNVGTAGACLVAVRNSILKKKQGSIPKMIDYRTHINKKSLYNTPPVFAILMSLLTLRWIKEQGGIAYFDQYNREKSAILYEEINRNDLFTAYAEPEFRSNMNVVFNGNDETTEERFLTYAEKQGIVGIKGHRSIGGFRASMYNALRKESVQVLADVMKEFERING